MRARSRRRPGIASAVALALVVAGFAGTSVRPEPALAAGALDAFDPADIIDDAVMFDPSTMTAPAIQAFLDAKQPTCATGATCLRSVTVDVPALAANPMCAAVPAALAQSVAQVIATAAAACRVNPRVILVMLQKEQTLVTGRKPGGSETVASVYRKATGLGCPDTAACDPAKYGLFNQLYGVAYWLVRYTNPVGTGPGTPYPSVYSWFPVGRANAVLYNPSAACGAGTITIQNKATASLYYYTPYQPNAAALAAGWGIGDACSAYGNRNFFLWFTSWFGSPRVAAADPLAAAAASITSAWTSAGGSAGVFGDPTGSVTAVASGATQTFAGGALYTSARGTVGLQGAALQKYTATGGPTGVLGWPTGGATAPVVGGPLNQPFEHGVIVSTSGGAWVVGGAMLAAWSKAGGGASALSWPIADAVVSTGGTQQAFSGGRLVITPTASTTVRAPVLARWLQQGAEAGALGWPTGAVTTVKAKGVTLTSQAFQQGVVVTTATGVFAVTGATWRNWTAHQGAAGPLGLPRASQTTSTVNGGGTAQRFTGGTIYSSVAGGTHALTGTVLSRFNRQGGTAGPLGWPGATTRVTAGRGGSVVAFTNGAIYASKAGTAAVVAPILKRYLAKGGPGGALGWPTASATTAKGITTQPFERGRITAKTR